MTWSERAANDHCPFTRRYSSEYVPRSDPCPPSRRSNRSSTVTRPVAVPAASSTSNRHTAGVWTTQRIVAIVAGHHVVAGTATDRVVARAAEQPVIAIQPRQQIAAAFAAQGVVARPTFERIAFGTSAFGDGRIILARSAAA